MLGTITLGLTIDDYGPISDNAGSITKISGLSDTVRGLTDCLDTAGNVTAAIGKGFAIGSAARVSLATHSSYNYDVRRRRRLQRCDSYRRDGGDAQ